MCCLVERGARQFVATPAYAALHIGLAGLVASRRQAKMGADVAPFSKTVGMIDGGAERQRGQRPDAWRRHQSATCRLGPNLVEHLLGESLHFPGHHLRDALADGEPVISVDTKKKELVGDFKNAGRTWRPKGDPEAVRVHDFLIEELGRAAPYGVYDLAANTGWVSVGMNNDTAAFAVQTIRRWWREVGQNRYPCATRLAITADGGGSNASRWRLWKVELQRLAAEIGIDIVVHHLPPGTSKWNKIEHRLFSFITMNWKATPLLSYRVIVELIAATTTKTGLTVKCELDSAHYPKGVAVSPKQMDTLNITRDMFHGEWNYTIHPTETNTEPVKAVIFG